MYRDGVARGFEGQKQFRVGPRDVVHLDEVGSCDDRLQLGDGHPVQLLHLLLTQLVLPVRLLVVLSSQTQTSAYIVHRSIGEKAT